MSRVTPTEVKQIVSTALDDSIVQTWIDGANTIVTDSSECIGGVETLLTKVELYLSAHFIAMLDPELRGFVTKEKLDVFETSYSNDITMQNNIDNTPYGTTANMLSKGCLANTSDRAVSFCSL
tara:strand:+ start:21869 stop:22237 length:369 start_codon:yes stop_codon:yes gene_type:complete